jgi:hypothetical protein
MNMLFIFEHISGSIRGFHALSTPAPARRPEQEPLMDAFKDRLSQRARDTSRPALAHQSLGRALNGAETALAEAMMEIMGTGQHDFGKVAEGLAQRGLAAPVSGRMDWDADLLARELAAINAELDSAYAEHGYGA